MDDEYDRVPLDAYEGMPYPEDDVLPWEDAPAAQSTAPAPAPASAPSAASPSAPAPMPVAQPVAPAAPVPMAAPAPAPASASAPVAPPSGPEPTADELNAFLSAGFGEGVVFQEVRE